MSRQRLSQAYCTSALENAHNAKNGNRSVTSQSIQPERLAFFSVHNCKTGTIQFWLTSSKVLKWSRVIWSIRFLKPRSFFAGLIKMKLSNILMAVCEIFHNELFDRWWRLISHVPVIQILMIKTDYSAVYEAEQSIRERETRVVTVLYTQRWYWGLCKLFIFVLFIEKPKNYFRRIIALFSE